ncbi:MAG: discoidin domain-containing protein [Clostridia bacterium]|nr:discoidin domain-containing protein [Clostridia bacterium]
MKKTALLLLSATVLSTALTCFSSCTSKKEEATTTNATTTATTTEVSIDTNPITKVEHDVTLNTDLTTLKTVIEASEPTTEEYEGYSMVTSGEEWQINSGIDYSLYDFLGTGSDLLSYIEDEDNTAYQRYVEKDNVVYYRVNYDIENEPIKKTNRNSVSQTKALGAKIVENKKLGKLMVYYQAIDMRTSVDYSSVSGTTGAFVKVSFHTNLPATYLVSVSREKNSTSEGDIIFHKNLIPQKSDDGSYMGVGKFSVPYVESGEYWINFISGGKCLKSIPFTIESAEDPYNDTYHLQFSGDWDLLPNPKYMDALIEQFYKVYPRVNARWGQGNEPKIITYIADSTYDGVAYSLGSTIVVRTQVCTEPTDIGFWSHELTHAVQQYWFNSVWWTENMANFGGFRYHHWSDGRFIQLYQDANQNDLYDWTKADKSGYEPYGDGSKWFFTYLDYHWPTTQDENGNRVNGLIDTINFEIKSGRLVGSNDDPYDTTNTFNKIVKEITGYDCMEDIRKQYAEDFKSGAWDFKGFADYEGNFLTENLPFVENPVYPMVTEKDPGDKTATALSQAVTEGDNLALGATVYKVSGSTKTAEDGSKLVDGDLSTKWCSTSGSVKDKTYSLDGTRQWIILDLGEEKTFNTYTIYNTQSKETFGNMTEWEILISNDGVNWTSVDYQPSCDEKIVSFNVGEQSARYVMIKGYTVDTGVGTVRLYEFQLYNQ